MKGGREMGNMEKTRRKGGNRGKGIEKKGGDREKEKKENGRGIKEEGGGTGKKRKGERESRGGRRSSLCVKGGYGERGDFLNNNKINQQPTFPPLPPGIHSCCRTIQLHPLHPHDLRAL